MNIILNALKEAEYLLSEEYQSVAEDDLRQRYDSVLEKLEAAIKHVEVMNNKT